MLEVLMYIIIGMFIGWNLPQPTYARFLQERVIAWFKGLIPPR